jgi:hypothetical protein
MISSYIAVGFRMDCEDGVWAMQLRLARSDWEHDRQARNAVLIDRVVWSHKSKGKQTPKRERDEVMCFTGRNMVAS